MVAPDSLAFDGSGNLYVANSTGSYDGFGSVTVYATGSTSVVRTILNGVHRPTALAFDNARNLYVANHAGESVTVDAPGSD